MWSRRNTTVSLFLLVMGLTVLFGCRAFEPEVVIVNKNPETYIIGSPAETSGGSFHFRVFWYGTDDDGFVERYVWALTDTLLQDFDTDDDEEDEIFNPAENIRTLEIGTYTTRTDSTFDFLLNEGAILAKSMTLHMVAIDDRGDFDRTPARLHFISNALGNPRVEFFNRVEVAPGDSQNVPFSSGDFIGFGRAFNLVWVGTTPNIIGYNDSLLAIRDTVPPDDGLFGFQWRIVGEVGDVWRPRAFNQETGDSFSFFAQINGLRFANSDPSGSAVVFNRRLVSGSLRLLVNTIDVAGVQVPSIQQVLETNINFPPETEMIVGTDPDFPDPVDYPYFEVTSGPFAGTRESFSDGDRVPDRAYVVFKARGRDDDRDLRVDAGDFGIDLQGIFNALGFFGGFTPFRFNPEFSELHRTPAWESQTEGGWSSDTLGFLVGPFEYTVEMRASDEHGRRDPDPATFEFVANYPPCTQCLELLNETDVSSIIWDDPCDLAACFADTSRFFTSHLGAPNPERDYLSFATPSISSIWYKISTGEIFFDEPAAPETFDTVLAYHFSIRIALHGKETSDYERTDDTSERIMAWSYQMDYEKDAFNQIQDGGPDGVDRLDSFTQRFSLTDPLTSSVFIDSQGVWFVRVRVAVPFILQTQGPTLYFTTLLATYGNDPDAAREAWDLTTKQIGYGRIQAKATDQPTCGASSRSSGGKYFYYDGVRIPSNHLRRRCVDPTDPDWHDVRLENFRTDSDVREIQFRFGVQTGTEGDYFGGPPPN